MSVCISFFFFSPHSHLVSPPLCPCRLPLTRLLFSFAERFVLVRVVLCWVFLFFWYSVWFVGSGLLCVSWCARVYFNVYTFLQFYVCCLALRLYIYVYITRYMCTHTRTLSIMYLLCLFESVFLVHYSLLVSQTYNSDFSLMQVAVYSFTLQPYSFSRNFLTMILWIHTSTHSQCVWAHFGF